MSVIANRIITTFNLGIDKDNDDSNDIILMKRLFEDIEANNNSTTMNKQQKKEYIWYLRKSFQYPITRTLVMNCCVLSYVFIFVFIFYIFVQWLLYMHRKNNAYHHIHHH